MINLNEIENIDFNEYLLKIENNFVDLILIDPPYGKINKMQLSGQKEPILWDVKIDWEKMFYELKRVLKPGGTILVFGQNPTYSEMLLSNKEQFKYEYIWNKNNCAQGFHHSKMPLIYTENIAVFIKNGVRTFNKPINNQEVDKKLYFTRWYSQQLLLFIGKTRREIHKDLNHRKLEFFFFFTGINFQLCSEKIYKQLISKYRIDLFDNFLNYEELKKIWVTEKFNSKIKLDSEIYNNTFKNTLNFSKDLRPYLHPTQKPIKLLEKLISIHSNQKDIVLDCFGGSGSTFIACKNLKRNFIGCELDKKFYNTSVNRLIK